MIGETVKVKMGQTLSLKLVILSLKYLKKLSQRATEATGKVLTEGFVTDWIIENKTLGLEWLVSVRLEKYAAFADLAAVW